MSSVLQPVFWASILLIITPILVYPAVILILGSIRGRRREYSFDELPRVTVMVAAWNEEKCIGRRIENLLQQDYPKDRYQVLVASDASTDATDRIASSYADRGVRLLRSEKRMGKSSLLFELSKLADGDILVFTDANTRFRKNTVMELVKPFADPSVGCVDGSRQNSLESETCDSVYWRYERKIKALSSRLGAVLGATGAVFAVKRSLYSPEDPARADDFETAVEVRVKGYHCVFNPKAIAAEPAPDNSSEYRRLVRIVSWMIGSAIVLLGRALRRGRAGLALQLVVHKILRWNMGLFAILATLAGAGQAIQGSPGGFMFLSVVIFNSAAVAGALMRRVLPSVLQLPYYFWLMSIASLSGILKAIAARSAAVWDHARN